MPTNKKKISHDLCIAHIFIKFEQYNKKNIEKCVLCVQ